MWSVSLHHRVARKVSATTGSLKLKRNFPLGVKLLRKPQKKLLTNLSQML